MVRSTQNDAHVLTKHQDVGADDPDRLFSVGCWGDLDGFAPRPPSLLGQLSGALDQLIPKRSVRLDHWHALVTSESDAVGMNWTEKTSVPAAIVPIAAPSDIRALMETYPLATGNLTPSSSPPAPLTRS